MIRNYWYDIWSCHDKKGVSRFKNYNCFKPILFGTHFTLIFIKARDILKLDLNLFICAIFDILIHLILNKFKFDQCLSTVQGLKVGQQYGQKWGKFLLKNYNMVLNKFFRMIMISILIRRMSTIVVWVVLTNLKRYFCC